jgi:DNA-binding FrmR family transcriptional regulator
MQGQGTVSRYATSVPDQLTRLRRIEGQVRGLQHMIERDDACVDILTQIKSVTRALESVAVGVLDQHVRECVARTSDAGPDQLDEMISDVAHALARFTRT